MKEKSPTSHHEKYTQSRKNALQVKKNYTRFISMRVLQLTDLLVFKQHGQREHTLHGLECASTLCSSSKTFFYLKKGQ